MAFVGRFFGSVWSRLVGGNQGAGSRNLEGRVRRSLIRDIEHPAEVSNAQISSQISGLNTLLLEITKQIKGIQDSIDSLVTVLKSNSIAGSSNAILAVAEPEQSTVDSVSPNRNPLAIANFEALETEKDATLQFSYSSGEVTEMVQLDFGENQPQYILSLKLMPRFSKEQEFLSFGYFHPSILPLDKNDKHPADFYIFIKIGKSKSVHKWFKLFLREGDKCTHNMLDENLLDSSVNCTPKLLTPKEFGSISRLSDEIYSLKCNFKVVLWKRASSTVIREEKLISPFQECYDDLNGITFITPDNPEFPPVIDYMFLKDQSPVFEKMFQDHDPNILKKLHVPGMNKSCLIEYQGWLRKQTKSAEINNCVMLLELGHEYMMTSLVKLSLKYLLIASNDQLKEPETLFRLGKIVGKYKITELRPKMGQLYLQYWQAES